jgi:hypothetical protein
MAPLDCHAQKHDIRTGACLLEDQTIDRAPIPILNYGISLGMFAEEGSEQEPSEDELFLEELFRAAYPSDPFYPDDRRQAQQVRQRVANFLDEEAYLEELEAMRSAIEFPLDDDDEVEVEYLLVSGGQRC